MFFTFSMKLLLNIIALFALITGLSSCSPNPHAEKIKILDSIYAELLKSEKTLTAHNIEIAQSIFEEISTISELASSYLEDTESDSLINTYHSLKSPLDIYLANYPQLQIDLKESQAQIKNLSSDLKKGLINEKAVEYYQEEVNIANEVISKSKSASIDYENVLINFNILQPKVLALVEERTKWSQ
jgi:hypothetical protein